MDEIWTRLETFLQQNAPKIYDGLAPGATEDEIAETEARTGFPFPPDVRQSYLRHNGQRPPGPQDLNMGAGGEFIPCYFGLLTMPAMANEWQDNIDTIEDIKDDMPGGEGADFGVKAVFLDPAWVPFAKDIGGNQICLDFDPAPGGSVGQVVEFDHEAEGQRCLAPSFCVWLETIVSDLEKGRLVWNEKLEGYEYPEAEEAGART